MGKTSSGDALQSRKDEGPQIRVGEAETNQTVASLKCDDERKLLTEQLQAEKKKSPLRREDHPRNKEQNTATNAGERKKRAAINKGQTYHTRGREGVVRST